MALVQPLYTVDTTFTAKDIHTAAASVYTFTAAASAKIQFLVKLTNAAGGGDYVVYLTHGWLGAGSPATMLPKTTATAAAGETIIEFQSMELSGIKNTDVVNVMVKGLAGDTSVNGAIRVVADNPSVFDAAADEVATVSAVTGLTASNLDVAVSTRTKPADTQAAVTLVGTTTNLTNLPAAAATAAALAVVDAIADKVDSAMELDGAVYRFTTNALEQAPTGGAGSGAIAKTLTVTDGTDPLDNVNVWVTTDAAGSNVIASGQTDANGHVTFHCDAGTYYVWCELAGYNFNNPATETWA
jgi:hypothetical protein